MKLLLKAEVTRPWWPAPAAHILISGGGLTYLQHTGGGSTATSALAVGMSYGRLLAHHGSERKAAGKVSP